MPTWATSVNQARALVFEAKSHFAKSYEASGKNNKNPAARPAKNATYLPSRPVPRNRSERKNSATPANIAVHLSLDANAVRLCWFFRDCRTARTDITTFAIAAAPSSVLDIGILFYCQTARGCRKD